MRLLTYSELLGQVDGTTLVCMVLAEDGGVWMSTATPDKDATFNDDDVDVQNATFVEHMVSVRHRVERVRRDGDSE